MAGSLVITLLSAVTCGTLVNAVPADPTITPPAILPRQANAAFIGWISSDNTWLSQLCDSGLTWYQSGNYAQCCPDSKASCIAATACVSGSQIYPVGSTAITTACTENYNNNAVSICNTAFIFESFGDSNPKTDIVCGDSSVNWSYYRQIPASATETSSSQSSSRSNSTTLLPQPNKSGSKAWIAGAVVGPVVGIALIVEVIFFLMRRKKNKSTLPQTGGATMAGPPAGVAQPLSDAKPQLSPDPTYRFSGQQPTSPAPQYVQPSPASLPGNVVYPPDQKDYHAQETQPMVAELEDQAHAVEMPGSSVQH